MTVDSDNVKVYAISLFDSPFKISLATSFVHSSSKGEIIGDKDLEDKNQVIRPLIGTTQIINADGRILNIIEDNDEDSLIIEEIDLKKRNIIKTKNDFRIVNLREEYINAWNRQNELGKKIYQSKHKKK